ncbi:DsrE family protein [Undibacterium umbellatum]|uniref:DsrE family protein n=1 Tax=Undibacterium umbellatum TaxID=2762300 RepID=A0ABR6ZCL6_9BURK|nr:DsrE family protein [Undibacterium umbellatum]MBC3909354.1 DsrE family protein [Undibacterium umbellatum]
MRQLFHISRNLTLAVLLGGLAHASVMAQQQTKVQAAQKSKVVFQVSDGESKKWELALHNVRNVINDMGKDNIEVEIVAYGPGIDMFKFESPAASRIDEIIKMGVRVVICENTMRALKITKADMLDNLAYVDAGVSQLIKRQQQGYAYIRP